MPKTKFWQDHEQVVDDFSAIVDDQKKKKEKVQ